MKYFVNAIIFVIIAGGAGYLLMAKKDNANNAEMPNIFIGPLFDILDKPQRRWFESTRPIRRNNSRTQDLHNILLSLNTPNHIPGNTAVRQVCNET